MISGVRARNIRCTFCRFNSVNGRGLAGDGHSSTKAISHDGQMQSPLSFNTNVVPLRQMRHMPYRVAAVVDAGAGAGVEIRDGGHAPGIASPTCGDSIAAFGQRNGGGKPDCGTHSSSTNQSRDNRAQQVITLTVYQIHVAPRTSPAFPPNVLTLVVLHFYLFYASCSFNRMILLVTVTIYVYADGYLPERKPESQGQRRK